ncbi:MAG TPA: hypothetical protein VIT93_00025 [Dehalococcoidia bacterium]
MRRYTDAPSEFLIDDSPAVLTIMGREGPPVRLDFRKRLTKEGGHVLAPESYDFDSLPADERAYWERHEVFPELVPLDEDTGFIAAYRQNELGEFVDHGEEGEPAND